LKTKIILALDVDNLARAKYFVNRLYPEIKLFKIGLRLFTARGPEIIKFIRGKGGESFLDLKFFDIPNTVAHAVRQAARLKIKMLTLHIAGGKEMLLSAVRAAKEESARLKIKRPLLIGVTVLTSEKATAQAVLRLANIGLDCGLDGVVCSVWEARVLREKIKKRFIIVTPGIRPKGYLTDDQKRTATAADALAAGADYIVVGRPILEAKEPLKAVRGLI
jgi:orotidine-5'-phosphate decarboxylase